MSFGVVMITSVFYPSIGGAQTHTLRLSQKLKAQGIDLMVITRHYTGLARYEEIGGIPTYRVGRGDSNKAVAAISYIIGALTVLYQQRHRYAIMHCHQMISPMTIGLIARLLLRKLLVINPHRSGPIGDVSILVQRRPITGRLRLMAARRLGDAFVCISDAIRDELRSVGVDADRLHMIVNGVDVEHFRPINRDEKQKLRRSLGLPEGPLVLFTGRLVREKGLDVLLNAWPEVQRRVPDAHVCIVGQGEQKAELEAQAENLGITEHVTFAGGCDDVAPYLQAADAFVLPSYAEGLPVALLEAMACGLPCVATAIGGTMQVLDDSTTGRLVPVAEPRMLGNALVEALVAPVAREWGERARQEVLRSYSLDVVAQNYINMYAALQGGAALPTPKPDGALRF